MRAYPLLSWDWFQLKNEATVPMVKVHPTFELMEILLRNNNKIRIAVTGADARYNGIYYAVAEYPAYSDPNKPTLYLVLYSQWYGYPLEKGYFTVLGEDTFIPTHIKELQSKVSDYVSCANSNATKNVPTTQNAFARSVGSYDTQYKFLCNTRNSGCQ